MSTIFLMYHFVTGPEPGPFTGLKGVSVAEFKQQLEWLCRYMEPLTHADLLRIADQKTALPDRSFHLSFDDGTRDHLDHAFPVLKEMGLTANFYPVTQPLVDGQMLTMEKQRYIHYVAYPNYTAFLIAFVEMVLQWVPGIDPETVQPTAANLQAAENYLAEFDFYSLEERFYRRVRNDMLSTEQFAQIIDMMFAEFYPDERVFIEQFYMNFDDLRTLQAGSMTIGGHTHSHPFLSKLSDTNTAQEISKSLAILETEMGQRITTYAYPYGDYSPATLRILENHQIAYALATGNQISDQSPNLLAIPRVDAASFDRVQALG